MDLSLAAAGEQVEEAEAEFNEISSATFVDSLDETLKEAGIAEVSTVTLVDSLSETVMETGIAEVSTVTLVDSLSETVMETGIAEVSTVTFVDSLDESGLDRFPSVSLGGSPWGIGVGSYEDSLDPMRFNSMLNGDGLDQVTIALDSLTNSSLDYNITNTTDFREEDSFWNTDSQNSRWTSVTDLNNTVFGDETTYENLDVLEDESIYATLGQENGHESSVRQFGNPVSPGSDSQHSAASTVSLGLHDLWSSTGCLPEDQDLESTFMEPERNTDSLSYDDEANQSTLTLGEEGRHADPDNNGSGSEEAESGSGSQDGSSGSSEEEDKSDSNASDNEPPERFRGKRVLATPEDVQKAMVVIANDLKDNRGWNLFRVECENTVHADNQNTLRLLTNTWIAYQRVTALYIAELQNKDRRVGHMVGFINKFTKQSTSYWLQDYNSVVREFQRRAEEHKRITNILDNNERDPRLPAALESVNVDEEELEKWRSSFKNKIFPIQDLLSSNDSYNYEKLEYMLHHFNMPQGKLAGTVSFENFQFLFSMKTFWQHANLTAELKAQMLSRTVTGPEEMNELTDFGRFYRLEFRAAKLYTLNQMCHQYIMGFASGFYDETTDFDALVRQDLDRTG